MNPSDPKDNYLRNRMVLISSGIAAVMLLLTRLQDFRIISQSYGLRDLIGEQETLFRGKYEANLNLAQITAIVFFTLLLVAWIFFILWTHRSYLNLRKMNLRTAQSPNWAIFGWLIPIIWWITPYMILRDVVLRYYFLRREGGPDTPNELPKERFMLNFATIWWILFWAVCLISYLMYPEIEKQFSYGNYQAAWIFNLSRMVAELLVIVLGFWFVHRMGKVEMEVRRLWEAGLLYKNFGPEVQIKPGGSVAEWYQTTEELNLETDTEGVFREQD